jgi:hypothetical protein
MTVDCQPENLSTVNRQRLITNYELFRRQEEPTLTHSGIDLGRFTLSKWAEIIITGS